MAQLTQAKFHTFLINHYIIKQEVTITLRVQELVIADLPAWHFWGLPSDGHCCDPSAHTGSIFTGQGNTKALSVASIENVFRHRTFIFHTES